MKFKTLLLLLGMLVVISSSVSALNATAGASDFWLETFNTDDKGGCGGDVWAIVNPAAGAGNEQEIRVTDGCGNFDNKYTDQRLFWNFANITSYLDTLHSGQNFTINNISFNSCTADVDTYAWMPQPSWGWEKPERSITASNLGWTQGNNLAYSLSPIDLGGNYDSWELGHNQKIGSLHLKMDSQPTSSTTEVSRTFVNSSGTCTAFSTDVGGSQFFYLSYDYDLDYIPSWNVTAPINGTKYQLTDTIYISADNITIPFAGQLAYNTSYRINGGTWLPLTAEPVNFSINVSIGTGSAIGGVNLYDVDVNFTVFNNASKSEIHTVTFVVGELLGDCSNPSFNQEVINFTFFDEEVRTTPLFVDYQTTLFTNNEGFNYSTSGFNHTFSVCSTNLTSDFITNIILQYQNESLDYADRDYFGVYQITNTTNKVKLYLLNSSKSTELEVIVRDQNDVALDDNYLEAHRYITENNTFILVDSGLVDIEGITSVNIDLNNILYKFKVVNKTGSLVFQTGTNQINNNPFTVRVVIGVEKTLEVIQDLTEKLIDTGKFLLNINETSKIITATYDDTTDGLTSEVCLKVTNLTINEGLKLVNETCSSTPSGSIVYNYSDFNETDLVATLEVTSSEDNNVYSLIQEKIQQIKEWLNYNGAEFFLGILVLGTLLWLGIASGKIEVILVLVPFAIHLGYKTGLLAVSSYFVWGLYILMGVILFMRGRSK